MEIKIKWIKRKQMTHENTYRDGEVGTWKEKFEWANGIWKEKNKYLVSSCIYNVITQIYTITKHPLVQNCPQNLVLLLEFR